LARSRKRQSHADRVASYLRRHPGATRQEARGHKPPPGYTEASLRRHREETLILRGEAGLTSAQRQQIKDWYIRRAAQMSARGDAYGAPGTSRAEAIFNWEMDRADWNKAGWRAFQRVREAVDDAGHTGQLYFQYGQPGLTGAAQAAAVKANFIEELNAEYGLDLNPTMRWALLYKPKQPERRAA
jgi:hypothetical protein